MKVGFHLSNALDRVVHPVSPTAIEDVVNAMIWDGDVDGAHAIARLLVERQLGNRGEREQERFYYWLAVRTTLDAVAGRRDGERRRRAERLAGGPRKPAKRATPRPTIAVSPASKTGGAR